MQEREIWEFPGIVASEQVICTIMHKGWTVILPQNKQNCAAQTHKQGGPTACQVIPVCCMPDQCTSWSGTCNCPTRLWTQPAQSHSVHTQRQSWCCASSHFYTDLHQCTPVIYCPGCSANGCFPHLHCWSEMGPVPWTGTHLQKYDQCCQSLQHYTMLRYAFNYKQTTQRTVVAHIFNYYKALNITKTVTHQLCWVLANGNNRFEIR
jgi:hypothetical protein